MPGIISTSPEDCVFHERRDGLLDTLGQNNQLAACPVLLDGLPQGTKPEIVLRCVEFVEHAMTCRAKPSETCSEGGGCQRTKQVLHHYFNCEIRKNGTSGGNQECSICRQVIALCRNHSIRCQARKGSCVVPHCRNNKRLQRHLSPNVSSVGGTSEEYQYVIQKLREAVSLTSKEDKVQSIHRLLMTNRHVTIKLLRCILDKKNSGKPVGVVKPSVRVGQLCRSMSAMAIPKRGNSVTPERDCL